LFLELLTLLLLVAVVPAQVVLR
jgi:hypothetical protein